MGTFVVLYGCLMDFRECRAVTEAFVLRQLFGIGWTSGTAVNADQCVLCGPFLACMQTL
jgi:hypothetical protein